MAHSGSHFKKVLSSEQGHGLWFGFVSWPCDLLVWLSYLTSLSVIFLTCKMGLRHAIQMTVKQFKLDSKI